MYPTSLLSNFAADCRDGQAKQYGTIQKSWKSSRRFYRLVGNFVSEDRLVNLVKVFVAIAHRFRGLDLIPALQRANLVIERSSTVVLILLGQTLAAGLG
jgi:hypothetical protein